MKMKRISKAIKYAGYQRVKMKKRERENVRGNFFSFFFFGIKKRNEIYKYIYVYICYFLYILSSTFRVTYSAALLSTRSK